MIHMLKLKSHPNQALPGKTAQRFQKC
uniref:Uncharacterized protein n=1 Tax=Arundo donax TaxID=35708 RepID=A0A0A9FK64_ARUDO